MLKCPDREANFLAHLRHTKLKLLNVFPVFSCLLVCCHLKKSIGLIAKDFYSLWPAFSRKPTTGQLFHCDLLQTGLCILDSTGEVPWTDVLGSSDISSYLCTLCEFGGAFKLLGGSSNFCFEASLFPFPDHLLKTPNIFYHVGTTPPPAAQRSGKTQIVSSLTFSICYVITKPGATCQPRKPQRCGLSGSTWGVQHWFRCKLIKQEIREWNWLIKAAGDENRLLGSDRPLEWMNVILTVRLRLCTLWGALLYTWMKIQLPAQI